VDAKASHTPAAPPIPFIDLQAQQQRISGEIQAAISRVLAHGGYIMGPEVAEFEAELARFAGVRHAISCANGTDALAMVLFAWGLKPGDAVFCPSFTFAATAEVVPWLGATPVFVDVDAKTFNLSAESLELAIDAARKLGLRPAAVIPVDLFGQPADYAAIAAIAARNDLLVLADAAQSFGATYRGARVGALGHATTTSFFPAKPLGCYGDGGAILTDDDALVPILKSLRVHGQGSDKYDNVRIGMNARLDTLQAAILIEKLKIFPDEIVARDRIAARYTEGLRDVAAVPRLLEATSSVWAQYTIRVPAEKRALLAASLKQAGIPTAIYYPMPVHRQAAYRGFPVAGNGLPVSDRLAAEVLSLPMHPYLDEPVQDRIIEATRAALRG
jgi:dTDP-4-amino-4,6-dideoxygalactose transaminase